ncbi:MAG: adenylate/guanylate cyclase domain-containing protein [Chloroflexota bacterium]|nr:adenylate/guanylate cyclase domain-containing protein [Chloroflexota bacterium]
MDAAITQLIARLYQTTYLLADPELNIVRMEGPLLETVLVRPAEVSESSLLTGLVPELMGSEELLADILTGKEAHFQLEHINRVAPDDQGICYLTMTLLPYTPDKSPRHLLLLVTDTTKVGQLAQQLTQQRNELRLLQQQLMATNKQLDFLFSHYVSREVVTAALEQRLPPQLGGESREVSVLFADLRGYTYLTEKIPPPEMVKLLNEYLSLACDAIDEFGGTIAQFMGDSVFSIFNAPNEQPDHAIRAVRAGLAIQRQVAAYNAQQLAADSPTLHFGVGINSGPALVGNTGSHWRYTYSALGDATNVGSRICSITHPDEVWLGASTQQLLHGKIATITLAPQLFKGKSQPMIIYRAVEKNSHQG